VIDESERARRLLDAQARADELFDDIERELLRPGVDELTLNQQIKQLAFDRLGVDKHWHKRIVRSGPNTLLPYRENPPNRVIGDDDIVFLDLGPVFADWEADVGRTYVLGDDPHKLALRDALEPVWHDGKAWFDAHPEATGADLYAHMQQLAGERGYVFGGDIAGHLVGEFPHERIADGWECYISDRNPQPMRGLDHLGRINHWILEVHLVDRERRIGGFLERLLTLPGAPSGLA
jgi:Xaa-Pro dipeptidase